MDIPIQSPVHDESFGRRLRRERERRQIALSSISANTKISVALFEGLERDDVSRWPSGIFRRSFIRSYAAAVGLDPDAVLKEFLERFPDPADDVKGDRPKTAPPSGPPSSRADELRLTIADDGRLVRWASGRWAAVAWDVGAVSALAVAAFIVLDTFWMPLGVSSLMYYIGGAFAFGTTPGMFLFSSLPAQTTARPWFWRRRSAPAPTAGAETAQLPEQPAALPGRTRVAVRLVRGRAHGAPRAGADTGRAASQYELHAVAEPDRRASI